MQNRRFKKMAMFNSEHEKFKMPATPCVVLKRSKVIGFYEPKGGTSAYVLKRGMSFSEPVQKSHSVIHKRISTTSIVSFSSTPPINTDDKQDFFLNSYYKKKATVGVEYSVDIELARKALGKSSIAVSANLGETITVLALPISGFKLNGEEMKALKVADTGDKKTFLFTPLAEGKGKIRILAFYQGTEVGHFDIIAQITTKATRSAATKAIHPTAIAFVKQSIPDLYLLITETKEPDGTIQLSYRISAEEATTGLKFYLKLCGTIPLRVKPSEYINQLFFRIEGMSGNGMLQRLENIGMQLFDNLFPQELKNIIWSKRDKIKTLKIDSDEPWIPWELCKLKGEENGEIKEAGFFCEHFLITRWIPGNGVPRTRIDLTKAALVVPSDSGLPFAKKESTDITAILKSSTVQNVPARIKELKAEFSKAHHTVWHFSGHGLFMDPNDPDNSAIQLEEKDTMLPEFITGAAENVGRPHPFVFLNACQVGKSAMGLTRMAGWATRFLDVGACAFIGAYWSISDESAYIFATSVYRHLTKGDSLAQAVLEARREIKRDDDSTWLAYTVYGDPFAKV
jgi:hypothetical protein